MDPSPLESFDIVQEQIDLCAQSEPKKEYGYPTVVTYQRSMRSVVEGRRWRHLGIVGEETPT